ncbi:CopG family transcriptional regulator [Halodesulfurarchaeum sp. HSR-GB]|uniref:CopG family transcriptional regulator n=1 Tax=Halodesulfurarchaeum sp. HSR-GB TaxID=3074077 RepID=UPI002859103E|nr:CopG family transcriptional regulator [Halodesulfurarchaeum sp. HSR-GB]MDR5656042.1 CopG family transcriptional regulator [Halodesulfurarchaeum sp. HSR-GB]
MGKKNKTISFRVSEEAFQALRDIAEERDISLSAVFRDYVDQLVAHEGKVRVVPENEVRETDAEEFPPRVEVPKSFVREHERLELEAQHLRDQLQEHKEYITRLQKRVEEGDTVEEVVQLEDLDEEFGSEQEPDRYQIG